MSHAGFQKTPRPTAAQKRYAAMWLEAVRGFPCVFCNAPPPSTPHHVIHERFSQRRPTDDRTIPVCEPCHRQLHAGKKSFFAIHGPDTDYLPIVADMIANELTWSPETAIMLPHSCGYI